VKGQWIDCDAGICGARDNNCLGESNTSKLSDLVEVSVRIMVGKVTGSLSESFSVFGIFAHGGVVVPLANI